MENTTLYMTIINELSEKHLIPFDFSGKKFIRCKNPNGKTHIFGISDEEGRWCFKARKGLWYISAEVFPHEKENHTNFGKDPIKAYVQDSPIDHLKFEM